MANTYTLHNIADFLDVPVERRERCLHELAYALELYEFAFTDKAKEALTLPVTWTDDGDMSASLTLNGEPWLSLNIAEPTP